MPAKAGIQGHTHRARDSWIAAFAGMTVERSPVEFRDDQLRRYARHIILQEVGGVGQARLLASRVLVIGAGGLGSPLLLYLAAAGVGTIGVIDDDTLDPSHLPRP